MYKYFIVLIVAFALGSQGVFAAPSTAVTVEKESASTPEPKQTAIKEISSSLMDTLETFRLKQAVYFAKERDASRATINSTTTVVPGADPKESGASGINMQDSLEVAKINNPFDYGMLVLSTALASFFASTLMFYGTLILLGIILLRAIFKLIA